MNTNATKLNEKLIRKILETNVNELVYSVDESDEKKYEEIRVGGKFKEVTTQRRLEGPVSKQIQITFGNMVVLQEDGPCAHRILDRDARWGRTKHP